MNITVLTVPQKPVPAILVNRHFKGFRSISNRVRGSVFEMRNALLLFVLSVLLAGCSTQAVEPAPEPQGRPNFEEVKDKILPRLVPPDFEQAGAVSRFDLPGIPTTLAIDDPGSVRVLTDEELKEWGKTADELFALGLENLERSKVPAIGDVTLGEGGPTLFLLSGESSFVASQVLRLKELPQLIGSHGSLVAVPTRHFLLAFPIEDGSVAVALDELPVMVSRMARKGPGSVAGILYYFDGHEFHQIPYTLKDGQATVEPPEEFLKLLGKLPEVKE